MDQHRGQSPLPVTGARMNLKLLVVQGKPVGKTLLFGPGEYYLGRGPECTVRFNSEWVSRQHCLLRVGQDDAVLRDLSSRNGTLVNGHLVTSDHRLANGEKIQLGPVVFEVWLDQAPGEALPVRTGELIRPAGQDSAIQEPSQETTARNPAVVKGSEETRRD